MFFDGPMMHGVVAGVAAIGMVLISRTMRPGETTFFLSIARPAVVLAAVPALWMVVQVLPLSALAHPMWSSAEVAIGHPLTGAISIDIGASVMALGQYLTIAAIAFWAGAVAVDRQRAEWILFSLMAATALIGLLMVADDLFGLTIVSAAPFKRSQAIDYVGMGVVLAAAAGMRTFERYETRHSSPDRSVSLLMTTFAACGLAFAVCVAAEILGSQDATVVATAYGAATIAAVVLIRRLGFGPWGTAAIVVPAVAIATFLAVGNPAVRTKAFPLAFATGSPASLTSLSQRVLDDAPLMGTGAGTFAAIAPVYRDINDQEPLSTAPTATAAIAIELGRPMLWLVVTAMAGAIVVLFQASLRRGRDSFYPAAGAGCLVTLLFLIFMNAGGLGTATAMIAAATLGLAFAQRKSRTVQQ